MGTFLKKKADELGFQDVTDVGGLWTTVVSEVI